MHAAHYLLPIFPPLVLVTAIGLQNFLKHISPSLKIILPIVILIILPTSLHTLHYLTDNAKPDARLAAKRWITHHIPQGALIGKEHYTPDLPADSYNLLRLPMDAILPEIVSPFYNIAWYADFDYLVTSEGVSARYLKQPEKFPNQIQFYNNLQTHWQRVATFSGDHFSGPAIHIYQNPSPHIHPVLYSAQQYDTLIGENNRVATDLLTRLADLFAQKQWHQKALDVYEHLLLITSQKDDVLYKMGAIFYQLEQIDQAQTLWKQALQNNPHNIRLLTNLGVISLQQGNTPQAIQYWENGLQQAPTDPDLIHNLVFVYTQTKQPSRAIQILQNALQINPHDTAFQSTLHNLQTQ
jgi:tetratricopeptide (TPR) repeat protein